MYSFFYFLCLGCGTKLGSLNVVFLNKKLMIVLIELGTRFARLELVECISYVHIPGVRIKQYSKLR